MKTATPKNASTQKHKISNRSHSPQVVSRQKNKENQQSTSNRRIDQQPEETLKICIQLANHHKKEAEEFKVKNEVLEYRVREQMNDMKSLKKELDAIKASLSQNHAAHSKVLEGLRQENAQLRTKVQELTLENNMLKSKFHETESIITVGESKSSMLEINPLTLAKQSRRHKYALDYESINFVPSAACIQCKRRDEDISEQRERYCNELRQLQQQVSELQRIQLIVGVMQQQLSDKNTCIDYLQGELDNFQHFSQLNLQKMHVLQSKLTQMSSQLSHLRGVAMKHSFSRTVA